MNRLTTEKPVSDMTMMELAHNCCIAKNGEAYYRDYRKEERLRDWIRKLEMKMGVTGEVRLPKDDIEMDEELYDNLQYPLTNIAGNIAFIYRLAWAMADLRERLKEYEDIGTPEEFIKLKGDDGNSYMDYNGLGQQVDSLHVAPDILAASSSSNNYSPNMLIDSDIQDKKKGVMHMLTEEQREFATDNHNLIYSFLHKMNLDIDDWYDIVAIGYVNAVYAYNPGKAKFSSYVFECMRNTVRVEKRNFNAKKRQVFMISLDEPCKESEVELDLREVIPDRRNYYQDTELSIDLQDSIIRKLSSRQKEVIWMAMDGLKQKEIADRLGVKQGTISRDMQMIKKLILKY